MKPATSIVVLSLTVLASLGCSDDRTCTAGMSISCTCVSGSSGAQTCGTDGTYGACRCAGDDAGATADAGASLDGSLEEDGGPGSDAGISCGEAEPLAFGAPIMTNMGGSIATVADVEGDERLEIVVFTSDSPDEVRIGTWSGAGLDGSSRQLLDLTGFYPEQVAVDDSAVPMFIGNDASGRVAYRFGATGYQTVELRFLPETSDTTWYNTRNGMNDIYGRSFSRLFEMGSAWGKTHYSSSAPLYRFHFGPDLFSAEQVDGAALFGADTEYLMQIDGDVNRDGVEDFILATTTDFWIVESGPSDTWTRVTSFSQASCETPSSAYRFALTDDLDGDGDGDLVLNWNCTEQRYGFAVALRNESGYQLVHHSLPDTPSNISPVALGDLDGDCDPDLLFFSGHAALNDGEGRFASPVSLASGPLGGLATVVDLDFDGDNDIVWAGADTGPAVQLNQRR